MLTPHFQFLLATMAGWVNRSQQDVIDYLQAENRILRGHLVGRRLRLTDVQRRLLAIAARRVGRNGLFGIGTIVTPDTLLRWYRRLVAQKYDGSGVRGVGRPRFAAEIELLTVAMAQANPGWGYTRIRGALYNLNHEVSRGTITESSRRMGLSPLPSAGGSCPGRRS